MVVVKAMSEALYTGRLEVGTSFHFEGVLGRYTTYCNILFSRGNLIPSSLSPRIKRFRLDDGDVECDRLRVLEADLLR